MDFYQMKEYRCRDGSIEVRPDFRVCRSKDIMIRGKAFYAIWDPELNLWLTDEYEVQRLVDNEVMAYKDSLQERMPLAIIKPMLMSNFSSKVWTEFKNYVANLSDNSVQLDEALTFANTELSKKSYASKKLKYALEDGDYSAYDEIIGTLYSPEERAKLEWAIGSIVAGDSKDIQKFIVLYGEAGAGKSTILRIIQKLFDGYYTTFDAKSLTSNSNAFSTEVFKSNPLVAIQHDGDLSKIEDNTKLNSIVSHEEMSMNEKYKATYMAKTNCFLFMATNKPVKVTDAKSGVIRRLIDVKPTGNKIPPKRYQALMAQVDFQLGAIAKHCLDVYQEMGKNYYNDYRPIDMILQTDVFFNFVEANYFVFSKQEGVTLVQAYEMYKNYCDEALVEFKLPKYKFREELKNYFANFEDRARIDGQQVRSYYSGFLTEKFNNEGIKEEEIVEHQSSLVLDKDTSILDDICADFPAQYANKYGTPKQAWASVTTCLKDLNTREIHYLKLPQNHIVIDFDLKDAEGNKSLEKNLEAASKWPPTYAEYSKSGSGIHLHYIYEGDPLELSNCYSKDVEIKVFTGNSALRRKLTKCNGLALATLSAGVGLPTKEKKMVNFDSVKSEKSLRKLIERNLAKEIHPGTKPSIDFIYTLLKDAYDNNVVFDVTDLRPRILAFANNSTHQADYCVDLVSKMQFKSELPSGYDEMPSEDYEDDNLYFFDVEVYPNLFLICWKMAGDNNPVVRMYNPSPKEIEPLLRKKLIGFNCRDYDNHIVYAAYIGYDNRQLYDLSQKIISHESRNCYFREAYGLSYTDILEFSSTKKSLKKFEIELGIHHQECKFPWDKPVSKEKWEEIGDYCTNDVIATEAVFNSRSADWNARKLLAKLSGLSVNDKTQSHAAKIIFNGDKNPQKEFVYTDLSTIFPGYKFVNGKSTLNGVPISEGGNVYAEPGAYEWVALLDVQSMHPTSIEQLLAFGKYTKNFSDIKRARICIKHKQIDELSSLLNGALMEFVKDESSLDDLSYALKIIINIVYGMTSAKFDNPFKDPRNVDNIVAKRGALFMEVLKAEVQKRGFTVAHIKTDSIKIPNATLEIINFVTEFGKKYGYIFEHEATYKKMCLVNDAVYIARYATEEECNKLYGADYVSSDKDICKENKKHPGSWTATGTQFAVPYVFKTLFSHEEIEFRDLCETKEVKSSIYLDFNESLPDVSMYEDIQYLRAHPEDDKNRYTKKERALLDANAGISDEELQKLIDQGHDYQFIGKVGLFCPVVAGCNGGMLSREQNGKFVSVTGTKGYRWKEAEIVEELKEFDNIDLRYYQALADDAVAVIDKYTKEAGSSFKEFVSDTSNITPWDTPCGDNKYDTCVDCPKFNHDMFDHDCDLGYDVSYVK